MASFIVHIGIARLHTVQCCVQLMCCLRQMSYSVLGAMLSPVFSFQSFKGIEIHRLRWVKILGRCAYFRKRERERGFCVALGHIPCLSALFAKRLYICLGLNGERG